MAPTIMYLVENVDDCNIVSVVLKVMLSYMYWTNEYIDNDAISINHGKK